MSTGSDLVSSANLAALADQVAFLADQPALVLLLVVIAGLLLGRVRLGGISLGSSGVIFVALAAGHLGFKLPAGIGTVGLVLFIYCIGLGAGPSFFRAFRRQGKSMALLATVLVVVGTVAAWIASRGFNLPTDLAAGVLAGALTSTPGLAAALESLPAGHHVGGRLRDRLSGRADRRRPVRASLSQAERSQRGGAAQGRRGGGGRRSGDCPRAGAGREPGGVRAETRRHQFHHRLQLPGVAPGSRQSTRTGASRSCARGRAAPAADRPPVSHGPHRAASGQSRYGIGIVAEHRGSKPARGGQLRAHCWEKPLRVESAFALWGHRHPCPAPRFRVRAPLADRIEYGDMLNVVGEHVDLERFAEFAGHRVRSFDETDLISLCVGVAAGVALGNVEIGVGGQMIRLGLAGGPLIVALVLGHLGHVGPIKGHVPRAARLLLTEIGLVLFLASAGLRAGAGLEEVLRSYGVALITSGLAVALAPLIAGALVARYVLHLSVFEILGGVCGGMTSTPGIGAVTGKTDADTPVVSYAAAYPVALILMTLVVRLLVELH